MSTPYNTRSAPLHEGEGRRRPSPIGFIPPSQVERAFIALLYVALFILVLLSIIGTFYGRRGEDAPIVGGLISFILRFIRDAAAAPAQFGIAIGMQFVLTCMQYGARQFARADRRWWILYLVALGFSVYYNVEAYWTPLTALVPVYLAGMFILAGDILPEFIAVRRHD